ncbi:hypothetical protein GON01_03835 [Sphingomonas sp. MAH-20]|uniref:Glycosyltransferase RgtA/B/C/D-like domain-containing protein n=1 Tax=Sphingomonas horti TaxID=2682842 RepID=A0A6I4IY18_9SPHN|nr:MULTISPECIES: hypothetical protein [Sphingomonas]MBA2918098.1 hypothetical protein [Sphingomonas sp. CGMCC 1.13658]MVO77069.1 hypothetical protein [Sphingomonas horti]
MPGRGDFLDRRWTVALLAMAAAIPLVWPPIPPLVDLLGHMGRFRVQTAIDDVPSLAAAYSFHWTLLGNLGVDLLIVPMAKLFGVELGTKLIVLAIPPLMVAGMLWVAREGHGRVPPTALFALPLAYGYPFQFGFINFALSAALAFPLLALWMRLGRQGRTRLRAAMFVPLSCLLWLTHMVGWGLLGLAAFGTELVRRHRGGEPILGAAFRAALACLALALPALPTVLLRSDAPQAISFDWFHWEAKWFWIESLLRDRWRTFDVFSAHLILLVIAIAAIRRKMDALLAVPALLCLGAFIVMPRVAMGSAYADMRLLPFTCALALLAIRSEARWIAAAGLTFFVVRLAATTTSFLAYDRSYGDELRALDHLPRGASVLSMVIRPCGNVWSTARLDHLPAMAIVRRDAFSNDQWVMEGAQALKVIKPGVGRYGSDPSQLVYPKGCNEGSDLNRAMREFNRAAFDHVWIIDQPAGFVAPPDLHPIWTNGNSVLYRVGG